MNNPYQPPKHEGQRRSVWWLAAIVVAAGALVWLGLASKQEPAPYVGPRMRLNPPETDGEFDTVDGLRQVLGR